MIWFDKIYFNEPKLSQIASIIFLFPSSVWKIAHFLLVSISSFVIYFNNLNNFIQVKLFQIRMKQLSNDYIVWSIVWPLQGWNKILYKQILCSLCQ